MNALTAKLRVDIEAQAPLLLGGARASGRAPETLKFIPGRVLRGALADALLSMSDHAPRPCGSDCDFCTLFLLEDGKSIFRNAYPARPGGTSRPFPFTALQCKIDESHPVTDLLCTSIVHWLKGSFRPAACSNCNEKLEPATGFCDWHKPGCDKADAPTLRETVKVGIDRARRCAADEILYSVLAVSDKAKDGKSQVNFSGSIICPSELADELAGLLAQRVTRLGGATSRGYGTIRVNAVRQADSAVPVADRIRSFNKTLADLLESTRSPRVVRLEELWLELASIENLPAVLREGKRGFFSIDLISDAILPDVIADDDKLFATQRQDFVLKSDILRLHSEDKLRSRLAAAFARAGTASGWNATWGLPRQVDIVSLAGGVFVYWSDDLPACIGPLESLEQRGIGGRISEGFGQVEICSPVHMVRV
ncbi:MAG TPA: CRISPR-associated RAMP protein Csx10 [Candidatus Obscuribacterales bacterium]